MAGIRGLGRAGVEVVAYGSSRAAAGLSSAYAGRRVLGPDPADSRGFSLAVAAVARQLGGATIYPAQEASLDALLAESARLPTAAALPYGHLEAVAALRDKQSLAALCAEAGFATLEIVADGLPAELLEHHPVLPCIVKPRRPGQVLASAVIVESAEELRTLLESLPPDEPVLLQAKGEGPLAAISLIVTPDGRTAARFQQRAVRTWPRGHGPSSVAVSVRPDEALVSRTAAMLAGVGYSGLAQLQLVETAAGSCPIDLNPRFYGSLPLALRCGINLPAVWHSIANGRDARSPRDYPVGVRYRWLEADVHALLHGRPEALLTRYGGPRVGAMWSRDDPVAGVLLATGAASAWITRQADRLSGRRGARA